MDRYDPELLMRADAGTENSTQQIDYTKPTIVCKTPSKVTKIKDLASNLLNQESALDKFSSVKDPQSSFNQVYDLVVQGLPNQAQVDDLKNIASAKHVVEAAIEHDTIKNVCTGVGKIKIRLAEGEDLDQIKSRFENLGLDV